MAKRDILYRIAHLVDLAEFELQKRSNITGALIELSRIQDAINKELKPKQIVRYKNVRNNIVNKVRPR